jgi:hypothetical protein
MANFTLDESLPQARPRANPVHRQQQRPRLALTLIKRLTNEIEKTRSDFLRKTCGIERHYN